jgi:hypothetical protein
MPRSRLALRLCLCLLAAPAAAQDAREVALAREILAGAQAPSFQRNRE